MLNLILLLWYLFSLLLSLNIFIYLCFSFNLLIHLSVLFFSYTLTPSCLHMIYKTVLTTMVVLKNLSFGHLPFHLMSLSMLSHPIIIRIFTIYMNSLSLFFFIFFFHNGKVYKNDLYWILISSCLLLQIFHPYDWLIIEKNQLISEHFDALRPII